MKQSQQYTVLPCNGLDKAAGCVAREVALEVAEQSGSEIICPVLYRVSDTRYTRLAGEHPLLVVDGCPTRCASKLAAEKNLKVARKFLITEEAKNNGIVLGNDLRLDETGIGLAKTLVAALLKADEAVVGSPRVETISPAQVEYDLYEKDKFIFRLPKTGFFFTENDCWVHVDGNRGRVGVTDFLQQSLSDVTFCTPPKVGATIEQFGELGTIEASKAVFEIPSPVTGTVVAVNEALSTTPELINQEPYERGWIVELELTDFEKDREFLLDVSAYFPILKRKVDEFHVK